MGTGIVILLVVLSIMLVGVSYDAYRLRKREADVLAVAEQVDHLFTAAREEVIKNKKLIEKAKELVLGNDSGFKSYGAGTEPALSSPELLATLVTVLVNKYGTSRLTLTDFAQIPSEEYVSVYVDKGSGEIILSLDHEMASGGDVSDFDEDPLSALFGKSPKDDTYH
jgi:hypothetical protein